MSVSSGLDRLVRMSRLDLLSPEGRHRSRNLRWLPLVLLIGVAIGFALLVDPPGIGEPARRLRMAGAFIFVFCFIGSSLIRLAGPRLAPRTDRPLDERELVLRARAGSLSGSIIAILAVLGCFYFAAAIVYGWWIPRSAIEWVFLGLIIQAWAFALPVAVSSWLQPPMDGEEE